MKGRRSAHLCWIIWPLSSGPCFRSSCLEKESGQDSSLPWKDKILLPCRCRRWRCAKLIQLNIVAVAVVSVHSRLVQHVYMYLQDFTGKRILEDISIFVATYWAWCVYQYQSFACKFGRVLLFFTGTLYLITQFLAPSVACKILGANFDGETLLATCMVVIKFLFFFFSHFLCTGDWR